MQESTRKTSISEIEKEDQSRFPGILEDGYGHAELAGMLEGISENLPGRVLSMSIESHAGPLPSPSVLAEYDRVCPGAAERILRMAELEQVHRHDGDTVLYFSQPSIFRRGQVFAFLTCLMGIGGAVVLGLSGSSTAAIALGAGPPIVLAGGFIGRRLLDSTRDIFRKKE